MRTRAASFLPSGKWTQGFAISVVNWDWSSDDPARAFPEFPPVRKTPRCAFEMRLYREQGAICDPSDSESKRFCLCVNSQKLRGAAQNVSLHPREFLSEHPNP
jgi:hypothetical protein